VASDLRRLQSRDTPLSQVSLVLESVYQNRKQNGYKRIDVAEAVTSTVLTEPALANAGLKALAGLLESCQTQEIKRGTLVETDLISCIVKKIVSISHMPVCSTTAFTAYEALKLCFLKTSVPISVPIACEACHAVASLHRHGSEWHRAIRDSGVVVVIIGFVTSTRMNRNDTSKAIVAGCRALCGTLARESRGPGGAGALGEHILGDGRALAVVSCLGACIDASAKSSAAGDGGAASPAAAAGILSLLCMLVVASESPANRDSLRDSGACTVVSRALRAGTAGSAGRDRACVILAELARSDKDLEDASSSIIAALRNGSGDMDAVLACCNAMERMAEQPGGAYALVKLGACQAMVAALQGAHRSDSRTTYLHVLGVAKALARSDEVLAAEKAFDDANAHAVLSNMRGCEGWPCEQQGLRLQRGITTRFGRKRSRDE